MVDMRPTHLLLVLLLPACASADTGDEAYRLANGTAANERNGAVQIRYPKRKADITDPNKPNRYCTGALIAEKCVITAGHCINVSYSEKEFVAGASIWHADATNNDANGRPTPKAEEVVAKASAVSVLGNEHRDLAVIKLDTALPGTTLALARAQPDLNSVLTLLGNGQTGDGTYAHATGDMKLSSTEESGNDVGYVSLVVAQIGAMGALAKFGDSGSPAIFGGGIVGIGSRLKGDNAAYYASVTSAKSRAWLEAEIKKVCGLAEVPVVPEKPKPGTTGGSSSGDTGDGDTGDGDTGGGDTGGGVTGDGDTGDGDTGDGHSGDDDSSSGGASGGDDGDTVPTPVPVAHE